MADPRPVNNNNDSGSAGPPLNSPTSVLELQNPPPGPFLLLVPSAVVRQQSNNRILEIQEFCCIGSPGSVNVRSGQCSDTTRTLGVIRTKELRIGGKRGGAVMGVAICCWKAVLSLMESQQLL